MFGENTHMTGNTHISYILYQQPINCRFKTQFKSVNIFNLVKLAYLFAFDALF